MPLLRRPVLFAFQVVLTVFVMAGIIVPLIAALATIPTRSARLPTLPPTTTTTVSSTTTTPSTITTSGNTTITTSGNTTTANTTTTGAPMTTTTHTTTHTTTTPIPTTTHTTTTHTTTTHTTTHLNTTTVVTSPPPTTLPPATCGSCATNAAGGACASEYAACAADFANCRIQCFNTFYFDNFMPFICFNGAIPAWPPLLACLCSNVDGDCAPLCPSDCNFTNPFTTSSPTPSPIACMDCYNNHTSQGAPCEFQADSCNPGGNNTSPCALLCADFYAADTPVFSSCTMNMTNNTIPEWPPLSDCLCPYCNSVCTENNRTCT